jgi:hypothetical protein
MKTMMALVNGTKFDLEPTLIDRHRDDSRFSDFQGTKEELTMLFASTFVDMQKVYGGLTKFPPGRDPGTFVMKGIRSHIGLFRSKSISRTIYGPVKPPAAEVDFIIRVLGTHSNGRPRVVQLIDFQAWPTVRRQEEIDPPQSAA